MMIDYWTILSDQSGSVVVDLWKSTYASFPPTITNSITGVYKPTLSSQSSNQSTGLTGWARSVSAGDIIRFNVDSSSTVTRVTLSINATIV